MHSYVKQLVQSDLQLQVASVCFLQHPPTIVSFPVCVCVYMHVCTFMDSSLAHWVDKLICVRLLPINPVLGEY